MRVSCSCNYNSNYCTKPNSRTTSLRCHRPEDRILLRCYRVDADCAEGKKGLATTMEAHATGQLTATTNDVSPRQGDVATSDERCAEAASACNCGTDLSHRNVAELH
mmetsp:Transcript_96590/g.144593  ORF Transcript_96590/g.144593 Transcript_96590/m.144593 type:complete len:107 (-) Transcript_96590:1441-1761(-)